jgi:hypothetical protein
MLIELWRKEIAEGRAITLCAICGNDFELGSVYPVVAGDRGQELGEMCPACLDYLNRRKADAEDPTAGNWPARDWPTLGDLEDARRRYPEPMFESREAWNAACPDFEVEEEVLATQIVWRMECETPA